MLKFLVLSVCVLIAWALPTIICVPIIWTFVLQTCHVCRTNSFGRLGSIIRFSSHSIVKIVLTMTRFLWESTISCITFLDFSMFYKVFCSPQMKRWAIIPYKHGIYELSHKLPNDLRLRILGN